MPYSTEERIIIKEALTEEELFDLAGEGDELVVFIEVKSREEMASYLDDPDLAVDEHIEGYDGGEPDVWSEGPGLLGVRLRW